MVAARHDKWQNNVAVVVDVVVLQHTMLHRSGTQADVVSRLDLRAGLALKSAGGDRAGLLDVEAGLEDTRHDTGAGEPTELLGLQGRGYPGRHRDDRRGSPERG